MTVEGERAVDFLAGLVTDVGGRWGDLAAPWQWDDVRAVLDPGDSPKLHFLTRPRGGSKTSDLAAILLASLLEQLPSAARCYWLAADREQARLGMDALAGLVTRNSLAGLITLDQYRATGPGGATVEVLAADGPGSFGLRPHMVVVDELAVWPAGGRHGQVWEAIVSAMGKVPGARLVVLSTAGDPAGLAGRVRESALGSPAWRVNEVEGPLPWVPSAVLAEQRRLLTDSAFARLHLNRWVESDDRLVAEEDLVAAAVLDGPQDAMPAVSYEVGVDLGLRHDRTAIAVAHAEWVPDVSPPARRVVLDRLVTFSGTRDHEVVLAEVEEALLLVWRLYGRPRLTLDPWQGVGLAQRLRARGVTVVEASYTPARYGSMASVLFRLLRDRLISLPADEALLDELRHLRLQETLPGMVRVQHDPGRHDDQAVAVGFAAVALLERGTPAPASITSAVGRQLPTTPTNTRAPVQSGTIRVGRFVVPKSGYTPPGQRRWQQ